MPEEVVPIVVIAIMAFTGLSIFIVHTIFSFLRAKAGIDKKGKSKQASLKESGASLTTSELQTMLRDVVEEANAPLRKRIEALEAIATDDPVPQLPQAKRTLNDELQDEGPRDLAAISQSRKRIQD